MEAQELLNLVGFKAEEGKEADIEAVRNHFNNTFVPVSEINEKHPAVEKIIGSSFGRKMGTLQTALISQAKENGLDFKHSDFADKKIDEIIPVIFGGFKDKLEAIKKPDSKLQEEIDRWKGEATTYKETVQTLQSQTEELKTGFESEKQSWLVDHAENEAWGSINFVTTANDFTKRGFKSTIKDKYNFVADAEGKVWPEHKDGDKKGSRVQNPNNLSTVMSLPELLTYEAGKAELLAKPNEGKPGGRPPVNGGQPPRSTPNDRVRVNPRFYSQE